MPINFTNPQKTQNYDTGVLSSIRDHQIALASLLDPAYAGTITSPSVGAKRINAGSFEMWNGSAWAAYGINYIPLSGATGVTGNIILSIPTGSQNRTFGIDNSGDTIYFGRTGPSYTNGSVTWLVGNLPYIYFPASLGQFRIGSGSGYVNIRANGGVDIRDLQARYDAGVMADNWYGVAHVKAESPNSNPAGISFHRIGFSAISLYHSGDGDNILRIRRWLGGDYKVWHEGNDSLMMRVRAGTIANASLDSQRSTGMYQYDGIGFTYAVLEFAGMGGSSPRVQFVARYHPDELYFRVAQTTETNFDSVVFTTNRIWHGGNFNPASYALLSGASFSGAVTTSGWFMSTGGTGWQNQTYGGGWYMNDTSWLRVYGSKPIYSNVYARFDGGLQVGSSGANFNVSSTGFVTCSGTMKALQQLFGNNGTKGFGAITVTTSTATPTGGADGDFVFIYS